MKKETAKNRRFRGGFGLAIAVTLLTGLGSRAPATAHAQGVSEEAIEVNVSHTAQADRTITLDDLVQDALAGNPAIQAAERAVDAKRSLVLPYSTLPDPAFIFQNMGNLIPPSLMAGDPSSARTFGIEQEIPFPGKLSLKGKMASVEADAQWWVYEETRREIVSELKQAYYELSFVYKSIETLQKDKVLLEQFAQIAEAKYRVGQGIQQDVLKAQVEISELLDRLTVLNQRKAVTEAMIISLCNYPPGTVLGRPEEIRKADLGRSLDELETLARDNDPSLKMQEKEVDINKYGVALSRKEYYPDFSVGFTYFDRDDNPGMYGLMFGTTLPVYFWRRQTPELHSAASRLMSSQKQRENTLLTLSFKIKDAYLAATTSDRLIQLYSTGVIPQSTLSLESAVAGYQVGKVDFLTLIDNLVTLLDYELKYYEALADFQKALARLEPLVGVELTH